MQCDAGSSRLKPFGGEGWSSGAHDRLVKMGASSKSEQVEDKRNNAPVICKQQ